MKSDKFLGEQKIGVMDRRKFIGSAITAAASAAFFPFSARALSSMDAEDPWKYAAELRRRIKAPTFPDRDFPVTDFGANGDGKTDCTVAINDAIKACSKAGGGRVVIGEGRWLSGAIHLLSNVNLHISAGATVLFYTDPAKYLPLVFARYEGMECMNYSPLIYAYEQENIAVTGKGTLDGQASPENWLRWKGGKYGNPEGEPSEDRLNALSDAGVPPRERIFGPGEKLRPCFIEPYKCKNVLIEGVKIREAPFWQVHPVLCTNVTVRGIDVKSHWANNDGCNPESCQYVLIEDCSFDTGDDCIAIKSGRNADGRRVNVPCQDIIVSNCKMKEGHGGVVIGSEMSGGARNVFVENCHMSSPDLHYMLRIKTNSVRGGFVENVHVRKIKVGSIGKAAIRVNFHYQDGDIGEYLPRVSNISVRDVQGADVRQVLSLHGYERSPIENVKVINCRFEGVKKADVIEHVKGLKLDRVYSDFKA